MSRFNLFRKSGALMSAVATASIPFITGIKLNYSFADDYKAERPARKSNDDLVIVAGTGTGKLAKDVADILSQELSDVEIRRFSDGEISCAYNDSVRGKSVFVIQSCAAPVNDNIMELLLLVSAAKRAGAAKVTAVVPYFGYKYHRRGLPISTKHQSRFLWSASSDIAKMLDAVGVDMIISVDLWRPGQGHEACFFDNSIPVETITPNEAMVNYFSTYVPLESPVVVVSPNAECVKKAIKFKNSLRQKTDIKVIEHAAFIHSEDAYMASRSAELLGNVKGADVIVVDEVIDTYSTLSVLVRRLYKEGARRVFLCATHGVFSENSMELIDLSPVERVVVTDTLPLSDYKVSQKIARVTMAPYISRIIKTEYFKTFGSPEDKEEYKVD